MGWKAPVIALLTDFGDRDGYAAAVKGVILTDCPRVSLVDVCHQIAPGNVLSASYVLASVWEYFPVGTIFVAVVDPGVGTERRALVAAAAGRTLVAPDNGLVSFLSRRFGAALLTHAVRPAALAPAPSATFHGRDVFAPAAALLARGKLKRVRGAVLAPVILPEAFSSTSSDPAAPDRVVHGRIVHLDRFGNAVSSIHSDDLPGREHLTIEFTAHGRFVREPYRVRLSGVSRTYADVPEGRPLAYVGSSGFLEIGIRNGSAAEKLGMRQGAPVRAGGLMMPERVP
jgi:S-adenosyl-L-methionine hydrolase (adenosine-forming)